MEWTFVILLYGVPLGLTYGAGLVWPRNFDLEGKD